jgi:hypothetical protein
MTDPYDVNLPRGLEERFWLWSGFEAKDLSEPGTYSDRVMQIIRESTCINCWHINSVESAAMWTLYSTQAGIGIKSSIERLIQAVDGCPNWIRIGTVQYVDFTHPRRKDASLCLHSEFVKRKSFEHERELRAVTVDPDVYRKKSTGVYVDVDVPTLIQAIYVAPIAQDWICEVVTKELRLHGLPDVPLIHSKIYSRELE